MACGASRPWRIAWRGAATPKANFTQNDGSLWMGKFPARDDDRDVGAWEFVAHTLAAKAGITVPNARLVRFNSEFHTFCVQRFDRKGSARAMTLLRKERSEGSSYLELAQFIRGNGDAQRADGDLQELFRRLALRETHMALRFNAQVYLFEFKVVELEPEGKALQQIKDRGYADKYRSRGETIHLIGIEFSRTSRNVVGFEVETAVAAMLFPAVSS